MTERCGDKIHKQQREQTNVRDLVTKMLEQIEDAADLQLIEQRVATAKYVPVTDEVWAEVERRSQDLTR